MTEHQLTCKTCGSQFTFHRRKAYCSVKCRASKPIQGRFENAACNQEHQCNVCDKTFKPKRAGRTTVCSRECGFVWSGFKTTLKQNGGRHTVTTRHVACRFCGVGFTRTGTTVVCSDYCRAALERQKVTSNHQPKRFDCAECGQAVETVYGDKRKAYCSDPCMKRALRRVARRKKRATLRAAHVETVDPNKVFDRDGWRCQLCRVKTPRSKRGTYASNAPELDHIMPLSLGGEHSYRNTQCLCRSCNGAKSNTPLGQLSLL